MIGNTEYLKMKQYSVLVTLLIISDVHLSMGFGIPMFEVKATPQQNVPARSNPENLPRPEISVHNTPQAAVNPTPGRNSNRMPWVPTIGGGGIKIQRAPTRQILSQNANLSPQTLEQPKQPEVNPSQQNNQWSPSVNQQKTPMQRSFSHNTQWSPSGNQQQAVLDSPNLDIRQNSRWTPPMNQQQTVIDPSHKASVSSNMNWPPETGQTVLSQSKTANDHWSPPMKPHDNLQSMSFNAPGEPQSNFNQHPTTNYQNSLQKPAQNPNWEPVRNTPNNRNVHNQGNPSFSGPDHNSQWTPPTSAPSGGQQLSSGNNPNSRFSGSSPRWGSPTVNSQGAVPQVVETRPRLQEFYAEQPVVFENTGQSGQNPQWEHQTARPHDYTGVPVDPQKDQHQTPPYPNPDWNRVTGSQHQTGYTHHTNAPHYSPNQDKQGIPVRHHYPMQQAPDQWNQQSFERHQQSVNWEPPVQNQHQPNEIHRQHLDQNGNRMQWAQPDVISEFPPPPGNRPRQGHSSQFLPEVSLEMFSKMLQQTKTGEPYSSITFSTTGPRTGNDQYRSGMLSQQNRYPSSNSYSNTNENDKKHLYNHLIGLSSYGVVVPSLRLPSGDIPIESSDVAASNIGHGGRLNFFLGNDPTTRPTTTEKPVVDVVLTMANGKPSQTIHPADGIPIEMPKVQHSLDPTDIPKPVPSVENQYINGVNIQNSKTTTPKPVSKFSSKTTTSKPVSKISSKATTPKPVSKINGKTTSPRPVSKITPSGNTKLEKIQTATRNNSAGKVESAANKSSVHDNKPLESKIQVSSKYKQIQDMKVVKQNIQEKKNISSKYQESTVTPTSIASQNNHQKPNESLSVSEKSPQNLDTKVTQNIVIKANNSSSAPQKSQLIHNTKTTQNLQKTVNESTTTTEKSKQVHKTKTPQSTQVKQMKVTSQTNNSPGNDSSSTLGNDASKQGKGTQPTNKPPDNQIKEEVKEPKRLSNYASIINTWLEEKEKPKKAENPITNTKLAATRENSALRIRLAKLLADLLSSYDKTSPNAEHNQISKSSTRADNIYTGKAKDAENRAPEKVNQGDVLSGSETSNDNKANLGNNAKGSEGHSSKAKTPARRNDKYPEISKDNALMTMVKKNKTEVTVKQKNTSSQQTVQNKNEESEQPKMQITEKITADNTDTQIEVKKQNVDQNSNVHKQINSANTQSSKNQTTVSTEEKKMEVNEHAVEKNQTPVGDNHIPAESKQQHVKHSQVPDEYSQTPVKGNQIPVTSNQIHVTNKQTSFENSQIPVENNRLPMENSQTHFPNNQVPVGNSQTRVENNEIPGENNRVTVQKNHAPVNTNRIPVHSSQPSVGIKENSLKNNLIPVEDNLVLVENNKQPQTNNTSKANDWGQLLKQAKSAKSEIKKKVGKEPDQIQVENGMNSKMDENQPKLPLNTPKSKIFQNGNLISDNSNTQQNVGNYNIQSGRADKMNAKVNLLEDHKTSKIPTITSKLDEIIYLGNVKDEKLTTEHASFNKHNDPIVLKENHENQEPVFGAQLHDLHVQKSEIETIGDKPYNTDPSQLQNDGGNRYNIFDTSTRKMPQTSGIPVFLDPAKIRFTQKTVSPVNQFNDPIHTEQSSRDLHKNEFIDNTIPSKYTSKPGKVIGQVSEKGTSSSVLTLSQEPVNGVTTPFSVDLEKTSKQYMTQTIPTRQAVEWDVTTAINTFDVGKHTTVNLKPVTSPLLTTSEPQYVGLSDHERNQVASISKYITTTRPSYASSKTYLQKPALAMSKESTLKISPENEEMLFGNFLSYDMKEAPTAYLIPEQPKNVDKYVETKSMTTVAPGLRPSTTIQTNQRQNVNSEHLGIVRASYQSPAENQVIEATANNANRDLQYNYPMEVTHDVMPRFTTQSSMSGTFYIGKTMPKYGLETGSSSFNTKTEKLSANNRDLNTINANRNGLLLQVDPNKPVIDAANPNALSLHHKAGMMKMATNVNELQHGHNFETYDPGLFDTKTGKIVDNGMNQDISNGNNKVDGNVFFGSRVQDNFGHTDTRFGNLGHSDPPLDNFGNTIKSLDPIRNTKKPLLSSGNINDTPNNFGHADNTQTFGNAEHGHFEHTGKKFSKQEAIQRQINNIAEHSFGMMVTDGGHIDGHARNTMTKNDTTVSSSGTNMMSSMPKDNFNKNLKHTKPSYQGFGAYAPTTTTKPISPGFKSRYNARALSAFPELRISRRPTMSKFQQPTTTPIEVITQPSIPTPAESNYFGTPEHIVPDAFAFGNAGNAVLGDRQANAGSLPRMLSYPSHTTVEPFRKASTVYNNGYFSETMTTHRSITDPSQGNHPALAMKRIDPTTVDVGNSFRANIPTEHTPPSSQNPHEHSVGSSVVKNSHLGPYSFPNPVDSKGRGTSSAVKIEPNINVNARPTFFIENKQKAGVERNFFESTVPDVAMPVMAIGKTPSNTPPPPVRPPRKEPQQYEKQQSLNKVQQNSMQEVPSVAAFRTPVPIEPRIVIDNVPQNMVPISGEKTHFDSFGSDKRIEGIQQRPVRPLNLEHKFHGSLPKTNMFPEFSIGGSQQNYINKQPKSPLNSEPSKSNLPTSNVNTNFLPMNIVPQMLTNTVHEYMRMQSRGHVPIAPTVTTKKRKTTTPSVLPYFMPVTTPAPVPTTPTLPTTTTPKRRTTPTPTTMAPTTPKRQTTPTPTTIAPTTTSTLAPTTTPRPTTTPKPTTPAPTPKPLVTTIKPTTKIPTTTTPKPTTTVPTTMRRYFTTIRLKTTPIVVAPMTTILNEPMPITASLPPTTVIRFTTPVSTTPAILTTTVPLTPKEKRQISKPLVIVSKVNSQKPKACVIVSFDLLRALRIKLKKSADEMKQTHMTICLTREATDML